MKNLLDTLGCGEIKFKVRSVLRENIGRYLMTFLIKNQIYTS